MKGVILAGGKGTRLGPLTHNCNKHLLMVGKEPMIYNPIKQLVSAGIEEILITSGPGHVEQIQQLVGDGASFQCSITYKLQEQAEGIAHALLLAEDFARGDLLAVMLGDNITTHSIRHYADAFTKQSIGAKVLLKKVQDPGRYGIAELKNHAITTIAEKPQRFMGDMAVTGIYFYDSKVFDIIRSTAPTDKGELEITPVNNEYLRIKQLTYSVLEGPWIDAGTPQSLRCAEELLLAAENQIIIDR